MQKEHIISDMRENEDGIIVGTGGRYWLCVVDDQTWEANGHKHESKLALLEKFGKWLPGGGWQEVKVDIAWNDFEKKFIVTKYCCTPYLFEGDVIYVRVS